MNFVRLKAIIRKEIYHLLRDYQSLYLAFAIPLILIILFGYALSLDVDKVETVVVDYDKSALSRDFVRKIDASPYFHLAGHLDRAADAVSFLDRDAAKVAIIIGPDFMKNLQA
ncbi:MAG TPA: ABC transporter permease, partial [Smithella sp.]|nr:ABC transporter permease [Smithellaceae bacterium]HQL98875.1 ABC transporter permease [Smithella sp.]